jgi:hypothetical protein
MLRIALFAAIVTLMLPASSLAQVLNSTPGGTAFADDCLVNRMICLTGCGAGRLCKAHCKEEYLTCIFSKPAPPAGVQPHVQTAPFLLKPKKTETK